MSLPEVTLKLAMSLDGAIALGSGQSQWITGPEARHQGHRLRTAHDAVLVGIGTALADDPALTVRLDPPPQRQPIRVVLDRRFRLPASSRLVTSARTAKVVVIGVGEPPSALEAAGVVVERAETSEIASALRLLRERHGVNSVLVEGGAGIAATLLREGLVNRLELFRAPILIGGDGLSGIAALGLSALDQAPRFEWVASQRLGPDLWDSYRRI